MAKQKLRESITVSSQQAIRQQALSSKDREDLVESIVQESAESTKDAKKLRERAEQFVKEHVGKSKWSFPVSRYDHINANRRRYPKALWEHVINNQKDIWEGCVGLADHPPGDEDPSFKDSAVIWNNLRMDETNKLVWADAIFVGENGRLAEDILDSGGKVGFSTAGMGDLQKVTEHTENGLMEFYDVVPEEFIIERIADVVPNPSQDVYGFGNMRVGEAVDAGTAQKMWPADDKRMPTEGEEHPPLEGEEANLPEEPHSDYDSPAGEPADPKVIWVSGDTSLREEAGADGGGDAGGTTVAGAAGQTDSSGAYAEAPENVRTVTSPGSKRRDEEYNTPGDKGNTMEAKARPTLNSFEQRRAYEDITRFIEKASSLSSPHDRLNEFKEIQSYLQDIDIPELHEQVEEKIKKTQKEIQALTESGKEFKEIFGTDISVKDVQGAMKNLSDVKSNLKESAYDWKQVSTKMAQHLKKFVEAVHILKERPTIEAHENLKQRNKEIQESLRAQMQNQKKKSTQQIKAVKEDLTKAHNALRQYIKDSKKKEQDLQKKLNEAKKENRQLREYAKKLKEAAETQTSELMSEETRYLFEGSKGQQARAENYRKQNRSLTETANSRRLNEDKEEVKEYFDNLLKKHGSSILPYSKQILEAKNYQEAVNAYMNIMDSRTQVDPDTLLDMDNPMIYEALTGQY